MAVLIVMCLPTTVL